MPTSKNGIPMLQNSGSTGKFDIVSKHANEALDALIAFDEYGGQPCRINDLTLIKQRATGYINECKINSTLPTWTGLAARLGVTRATANEWLKDSNYPDTQQYMKFIKQVFADIMEQAALDGSVDKIFSMFLLKSTHEYQETNKVVIEAKPNQYGEELTDDEIESLIEE